MSEDKAEPKKRHNYVRAHDFFRLKMALDFVHRAFGETSYHVGSSLEREDYNDIDIRLIMDDDKFDMLFGRRACGGGNGEMQPFWTLINNSVTLWLQQQTGLNIDFQVQRRTEANAGNSGRREAMCFYGDYHLPPWHPDYDEEKQQK